MNNFTINFLLTSIAGLSTLLGYLVIFFKCDKEKIIIFSLSLASSVMLTISIIDLLPSAFKYLNEYNILFQMLIIIFFFILGIFISNYISHHVISDSDSLKKVGIISLIAIILHNIPEGIITFMVSNVNIHLGIELALGISLHNIPEGISIAIPYYYATNKKIKTFLLVLIAGLSEMVGGLICFIFLNKFINDFLIGIMFSFISGIMINVSLNELLPEIYGYKKKKIIIYGFILGSLIMIISHIL